MITDAEYIRHDGVALAELVRRGELTASELLEAAIRRAEALNPRLNAIVIPMYETARAARPAQGPLTGLPFLIKDLLQDYAGAPLSSGSRALRNAGAVAKQHSEIVRRFIAAGTVIFGRTNTPELGSKGITEPLAWGSTRNPWNLERSPGGSSGGSAAAVAAGIVPMAGASDGGGSIRIPAAATGLFGLKPGRGRTPSGPGVGEAIHGGAMNHVLSRSVRDSAVMLDAIHGPELGAPYVLAPPECSYASMAARDPARLRIAYSTRSPLGHAVDGAMIAAVEQTARLLTDLGHDVEPAAPDIDGMQLGRDFLGIWFAQLACLMQTAREQFNVRSSDFELDTLAMEAVARGRSALDYARHYVRWNEYGYRLGVFLSRHDVFMTPTLAQRAPRIGEVATPPWAAAFSRVAMPLGLLRLIAHAPQTVEQMALENMRVVPFTQLANVTGVPAMSVPLHTCPDGMPLGIHFLAGHGAEGLLLSLAGQLERAAPWSARRPAFGLPRAD
jgi:amidase